MDVRKELLELFNDPLLTDVRPKPIAPTADDRLQQKLAEVSDWIAKNGREPRRDGDLKEKMMAAALNALKERGLWI